MSISTNKSNEYLNFDLLITRAGDAYRAYIVDASGGDADVTFEMPFALEELVRLVHGEGTRRGLHENGQFNTLGVEQAEWLVALEAGQNLWVDE